MKGLFFIIILIALLAGGYVMYNRVENPKAAGESKDLFDLPNMAKDKMEKFKDKTQENYDELKEME